MGRAEVFGLLLLFTCTNAMYFCTYGVHTYLMFQGPPSKDMRGMLTTISKHKDFTSLFQDETFEQKRTQADSLWAATPGTSYSERVNQCIDLALGNTLGFHGDGGLSTSESWGQYCENNCLENDNKLVTGSTEVPCTQYADSSGKVLNPIYARSLAFLLCMRYVDRYERKYERTFTNTVGSPVSKSASAVVGWLSEAFTFSEKKDYSHVTCSSSLKSVDTILGSVVNKETPDKEGGTAVICWDFTDNFKDLMCHFHADFAKTSGQNAMLKLVIDSATVNSEKPPAQVDTFPVYHIEGTSAQSVTKAPLEDVKEVSNVCPRFEFRKQDKFVFYPSEVVAELRKESANTDISDTGTSGAAAKCTSNCDPSTECANSCDMVNNNKLYQSIDIAEETGDFSKSVVRWKEEGVSESQKKEKQIDESTREMFGSSSNSLSASVLAGSTKVGFGLLASSTDLQEKLDGTLNWFQKNTYGVLQTSLTSSVKLSAKAVAVGQFAVERLLTAMAKAAGICKSGTSDDTGDCICDVLDPLMQRVDQIVKNKGDIAKEFAKMDTPPTAMSVFAKFGVSGHISSGGGGSNVGIYCQVTLSPLSFKVGFTSSQSVTVSMGSDFLGASGSLVISAGFFFGTMDQIASISKGVGFGVSVGGHAGFAVSVLFKEDPSSVEINSCRPVNSGVEKIFALPFSWTCIRGASFSANAGVGGHATPLRINVNTAFSTGQNLASVHYSLGSGGFTGSNIGAAWTEALKAPTTTATTGLEEQVNEFESLENDLLNMEMVERTKTVHQKHHHTHHRHHRSHW